MPIRWTKQALFRRIDRCYLVAARTHTAEKRVRYIGLAREYRALLSTPLPLVEA